MAFIIPGSPDATALVENVATKYMDLLESCVLDIVEQVTAIQSSNLDCSFSFIRAKLVEL